MPCERIVFFFDKFQILGLHFFWMEGVGWIKFVRFLGFFFLTSRVVTVMNCACIHMTAVVRIYTCIGGIPNESNVF